MTGSSRVFISGVAGFLGSHLADHLLRLGHEVVGCDTIAHGGEKENVPSRVEFHQCDARDHARMCELTKNVDVVFHAAALGHDGFSVSSPYLITENLFSSTASLVSASARNKVRRFVYCSSMARYGHPIQDEPFRENMTCRPVTPYGIAKLSSEELVKNVAQTHGMEWVICVPHNIIGPRQKYDDPYRNVAAIMINCLLQNRPPVIYGEGEQRRCFSSIWDTLSVLEPLLFSDQARSQVVNVGPDEEFVTINQLFQLISRLMGSDLSPLYLPARPLEVKDANCSADKARKLFGYRTKHRLEDSIGEMVEWIKARGAKPFRYVLPLEVVNESTPKSWQEKIF